MLLWVFALEKPQRTGRTEKVVYGSCAHLDIQNLSRWWVQLKLPPSSCYGTAVWPLTWWEKFPIREMANTALNKSNSSSMPQIPFEETIFLSFHYASLQSK